MLTSSVLRGIFWTTGLSTVVPYLPNVAPETCRCLNRVTHIRHQIVRSHCWVALIVTIRGTSCQVDLKGRTMQLEMKSSFASLTNILRFHGNEA